MARLAGGGGPGAIAGSTATADALFRNIVAHAAVPRTAALRRAVAMTASTPARALGLPDVGELAVGRRADLVGLSRGPGRRGGLPVGGAGTPVA